MYNSFMLVYRRFIPKKVNGVQKRNVVIGLTSAL